MREILTFEKAATAEVKYLNSGAIITLGEVTKVIITDVITIISAEPQIWQFPTAEIRVCYEPKD